MMRESRITYLTDVMYVLYSATDYSDTKLLFKFPHAISER